MMSKPRDLDAWATALGARTDDEAIAELRRLQTRVWNLHTGLCNLFNTTPNLGPKSTPELEEVAAQIHQASVQLDQAANTLGDVRAAFEIHERGNS